MKNILFTLLLISKPALAMHAYATDNCVAKTLEGQTVAFELSNDQPSSPHRLVPADNQPGQDNLWVNLDQTRGSTDMPVKDSALVLKTIKIERGLSKKLDDGCFQGSAWTYVRTASVTALNETVKDLFQLSAGEVLRFSCYSDYQAPTGKHCP